MKLGVIVSLCAVLLPITVRAEDVKVAVAANVAPAAVELAALFEREHSGSRIVVVAGSSGKLATQIRNGAPFDVFLSADRAFAEGLEKAGCAEGKTKIYARGILILFSRKLDLSQGLSALREADIVAVAKPELAPYGRAAFEALESAKLLKEIRGKFVYAENVSQAAQFALTAADAGFFNKSALAGKAFAPYADKERKNWIEIPAANYTPLDQGAVLLKQGGVKKEAAAFFEFLFTPAAKALFQRYGYLMP